VVVIVETVKVGETPGLSGRISAGPRVEGVLVMVCPGPTPAAVERSLRRGEGRVAEALVRARVSDLEAREAGPILPVRARTSSPALSEAHVADLTELTKR
jgi:hypothetical protein